MADQIPALPLRLSAEEAQVTALVGDAANTASYVLDGATVAIGPLGTVIITEAGDWGPDRSGVWNAEELRLFGPAPTSLTERLTTRTGRDGTDGKVLPVHLMVRVEDGFLYLGVGRTAQVSQTLRPGQDHYELTRAVIQFQEPLSKPLLDRVRPPAAPVNLPGMEWLRHVGNDRSAALEQFVTGWHPATETPDIPPTELMTEVIPDSLRRLYRLAAQRPAVLGVQNSIRPPSDLRVDERGEMLVFGVENQGGFTWSLWWPLHQGERDPIVWFLDDTETPIAEQEPLSGFLLQFSLFEASMGADYLALPRSQQLTAQKVDQLTEQLLPVPLRPFWPWAPTRFYVAPGLVLHVCEVDGGKFEAWAGATHRTALAPLADAPVEWLRFDG
ncbi:hypothetical protein [Streptomyces sp. NPDC056600]|uniref:hypothetical protein n=1 Tax=Streptomyces sp. NPDC056600 TaxID=3345874 RepID=UPI0036AE0BA4